MFHGFVSLVLLLVVVVVVLVVLVVLVLSSSLLLFWVVGVFGVGVVKLLLVLLYSTVIEKLYYYSCSCSYCNRLPWA